MKLEYSLGPRDFLQYHLFVASHSKRLRRKRRQVTLTIAACMFFIAFLSYDSGNKITSASCFFFAVLTLLFYPLFQRYHYERAYEKNIQERYKKLFGKPGFLEIKENELIEKDSSSETKMLLSEVAGVIEVKEYFFPEIKTGGHIIIPKDRVAATEVKEFLQSLCSKLNIEYKEELNWKWK